MFLYLYFVTSFLSYLLSMQIQVSELSLLTGKYNYRIQAAQYVTYVSSLLTLLLLIVNIKSFVCLPWLALSLGSLVVTFIVAWRLSPISPHHLFLMLKVAFQHFKKIKDMGLVIYQGQHDYPEAVLELGVLIELV